MLRVPSVALLACLLAAVSLIANPASARELDCSALANPFAADPPESLLQRTAASGTAAARGACMHDPAAVAESAGEIPEHMDWYATQTAAATAAFAEERMATLPAETGAFLDRTCLSLFGSFGGACQYADALTP